jgi:hypothetical protein
VKEGYTAQKIVRRPTTPESSKTASISGPRGASSDSNNGSTVSDSIIDGNGRNTHDTNDTVVDGNSEVARDTVSVVEEPRGITVRFLSNSLELLRKRPWDSCNSSKRLFLQAIAARIVKPGDDAVALLVRVAGFEDMVLMKDDEEDFESLRGLIEDTALVKPEYSDSSVDVDVSPVE